MNETEWLTFHLCTFLGVVSAVNLILCCLTALMRQRLNGKWIPSARRWWELPYALDVALQIVGLAYSLAMRWILLYGRQ